MVRYQSGSWTASLGHTPSTREELVMDANRNGIIAPSTAADSLRSEASSCEDCEKRSGLQVLVAELLCENQSLRFNILEARTRVGRLGNLMTNMRVE